MPRSATDKLEEFMSKDYFQRIAPGGVTAEEMLRAMKKLDVRVSMVDVQDNLRHLLKPSPR